MSEDDVIDYIKTVRDLSLKKFESVELPEEKIDALLEGYDDLLAMILSREMDDRIET